MRRAIVALGAVALLAAAAAAMAQDTTTVAVSATVAGTCKFESTGSVNFTLDPSVGGNVNGTVTQPTFRCTKGVSYTISDDYGQNKSGTTRQMKHANQNEFIPYSFTYTASGSGSGYGTLVTMDISATVAGNDYINASAGTYSDTVTLTINL